MQALGCVGQGWQPLQRGLKVGSQGSNKHTCLTQPCWGNKLSCAAFEAVSLRRRLPSSMGSSCWDLGRGRPCYIGLRHRILKRVSEQVQAVWTELRDDKVNQLRRAHDLRWDATCQTAPHRRIYSRCAVGCGNSRSRPSHGRHAISSAVLPRNRCTFRPDISGLPTPRAYTPVSCLRRATQKTGRYVVVSIDSGSRM
jgi:hypothetical protein